MVILPSAVRTKAAVGSPFNTNFRLPQDAVGAIFRLDCTAAAGTTPTLDVKFQAYDDAAAEYFDMLDTQSTRETLAFAQISGATSQTMLVYPFSLQGAQAEGTTDVIRVTALPTNMRLVCTYGADSDESFTFSVGAVILR
jgi:hypothetical protein